MTLKAFTINTRRLHLRAFREQDAPDLYRLNSDPEVLRYTGDEPFPDIHAAVAFINTYSQYHQHGFGRWAVLDKHSGEFMGFCGLRRSGCNGEVDLGFRLFRRFWAQGIATEASMAALAAGFDHFKLKEIIGRSMRENLPSITILQKLGLKFREVAEENGLIWLIYAITAEEYQAKNPVNPHIA